MGRISIYPTSEQEAVLLRYCEMAEHVYKDCYEFRSHGNRYFDIAGYVVQRTSPVGKFKGYPVWLLLCMTFTVSMDLLNEVVRKDLGSFFGLGSEASVTPNKGLSLEGVEGYIKTQEGYLPVVMSDKSIRKEGNNWYLSWR